MCGNYQRKGKSACKFKSFNKDKLETAVINSLLKEFTFLAMDKVLDEELIRYTSSLNKELTFKLNNITQQIELINMRIELSKKELSFSTNKVKLEDYINELNIELKNLLTSKDETEKALNSSIIPTEEINLTRDKIKDFLIRIYSSTPDVQNMLLKQFIESVNYNLINDTISIHIIIKSNSGENVLLDKNLYASF